MKFVIIYAFVVALLQTASAQSHNNQWGAHEVGDRLLHREIVQEEHKFMKIVSKDVNMKVPGIIHFIKATDQYVNGNGGYATLSKGGIGENEVTIHMKSQRNHGFNFIVEIYGK
ncbi:uncharacterized protein CBL_07052 [Carabus blaptoides fortunei]